jgi:hypothetical protein
MCVILFLFIIKNKYKVNLYPYKNKDEENLYFET